MAKARVFNIVKRFSGYPVEQDFELVEQQLKPLQDGEVLGKTLYLSVDPYMRIYVRNLPLGSPMIGGAVARIVESKNPQFKVGDIVYGRIGWRTAFVSDGKDLTKATHLPADVPESLAIGTLGMPGRTAYFGLLDVCKPLNPGAVVLVNGAAGAVGNVVGQIAKIKGCVAIGYAGSDEKVEYLKSIGFDHAFNYKKVDIHESLSKAAPDGVDAFFDNVGGDFADTVILRHMKQFGRVAICGSISQYNLKPESEAEGGKGLFDAVTKGPRLQGAILGHQLKVEGFIVLRFADRNDEANSALAQWVKEGKLKWREHVTEGFENMPKAFIAMLKGANIGKAIVKNTE
ncbi:prostaglandin reductase 1-like [Corticium candelabrum]|uniref:prostaglandin reductase 1-like n=1 Tax=Corticium candelabrum TaxID=121492 RepID=UPI002E269841|nr:prostaglandin reductase 1-like [Corticium candelabrum]